MTTLRLKRIVRNITDRRNFQPEQDRYVGLEHIQSWTGAIEAVSDAVPDGLVGVFKPGDILFGKLRPYLAKVAAPDFEGVCSTEALILRPESGADTAFLRYALSTPSFIDLINSATFGAKMPRASWENVGRELLYLPDLATQKRIADFLDRETARIDALIEKKERFLALAEDRWRAQLNHTIFPNSPDWSCLAAGWRKVRLKYLTDQRRPIMYGIVLPGPNMDDGPLIVKGGDVKPGRLAPERLCRTTREIEAGYARSRLKTGDLVISIRGGIGDVEIVPKAIEGANLTQDAARIAPAEGVDQEWLRYALQSSAVFHPLEAKSLGAAVRGINIFDLKRVYVPTPPAPIQAELASYLAKQERRLEALRSAINLHIDRLREYRAALITAAVTGQIDVADYARRGGTDRRLDEIEEEMQA